MNAETTAILLVGYQNDYFAEDGIVRSVLEEDASGDRVREATMELLGAVEDLPVTIIATPILFTDDYQELVNPVGILKTIQDVGAFRRDGDGGRTIPEIAAMGDRVIEIPGKRGLNAFSNTELETVLHRRQIEHVVMAGVVTSICIDSTGRGAHERGFSVSVLSDCTAGRTRFEQDFYCREVFPLYGRVTTAAELTSELRSTAPAPEPAPEPMLS